MPEPSGSFIEDEREITQSNSGTNPVDKESPGIPVIKPLEFAFNGSESPEPPRKRRGRPPGSRNSGAGNSSTTSGTETQKAVPNIIASIEEALWTACLMGANMAHAPEFEITHEEARQIDIAVKGVAKFYDHNINPKAIAWFQLCTVVGGTFYPRTLAYRDRKKRDAQRTPAIPINRTQATTSSKVNGSPAPSAEPAKPVRPRTLAEMTPSEFWPEGGEGGDGGI